MSGAAPEGAAALRAARLARLRAATGDAGRALEGSGIAGAREDTAAVLLPFPRPAQAAVAAAACDLDRLPGAGPGLVWALRRAGFGCRADLAPLAPEELAARLGPLGTLAPAAAWIAEARALGA